MDTDFYIKAYQTLSRLIRISNETVDVKRRLEYTVLLLSDTMDAHFSAYFSAKPRVEYLVLEAASDHSHRKRVSTRLKLEESGLNRLAYEKKPFIVDSLTEKQRRYLEDFIGKPCQTLLAAPVCQDNAVFGLLVLCDKARRVWSQGESDLIAAVSREIAGIMGNEEILQSSKKRIAELTALFEVEKVLGKTLDLQNLLQSMSMIITKVMDAGGCAISITGESERETGAGQLVTYGEFPEADYKRVMDYSSSGKVEFFCDMATRTTADAGICPQIVSQKDGPATMIAPLTIQGKVTGSLCVHEKNGKVFPKSHGFTTDDVRLLSTMGSMISKSLESVLVHADMEALARENEAMVRELSTIYQISGELMKTVSVDEIGNTVISAITSDEGLGFDRAVILMINEKEKALKEAWRKEKGRDTTSSGFVLPLNNRNETLRGADEGDTLIVEDLVSDPEIKSIWPVMPDGAVSSAVVPLLGKDGMIGVIIADQVLVEHAQPKESARVLKMLANHAGLALENARLYSFLDTTNKELVEARGLLTEAEKLAAMGEMASTLAHEIRNPLVSIGGLARRAIKVASGKTEKRYLEVIVDEVGRLEKTLKELLDFVQEPEETYTKRDLNNIIKECLQLMQREFKDGHIAVNTELNSVTPILCDARQIKHTLFNILLNARQAMPAGGSVQVSSSEHEEGGKRYGVCTIRDSGRGIPESVLHNIFNPFFTTKKGGFGLGLAVSYRIVSRHNGKIDVDNHPGRGVAFSIKLPIDSNN
ncbi:MAG: ATP-binding protein [Pseudomonadota bacterium]